MTWATDQQNRFDALRRRALTADLTPAEQAELDALQAQLEGDWRPNMEAMRAEQADLREALAQAEATKANLQQHIRRLEAEIADLRDLMKRLTEE